LIEEISDGDGTEIPAMRTMEKRSRGDDKQQKK
jgi:hypothetical protein